MPRIFPRRALLTTALVPMVLSAAALADPAAGPLLAPCSPGSTGALEGPLAGLVQPAGAPDELLALIEISAGSAIKYELHEPSGRMEVDRFLAMPMAYPANYGVLPCTLAGDGDALDVLVLTRAPVLPGSVLRVRPIGVLRMLDRGEEDDKILAVPMDAVDATFAPVRELADLAPAERDRIEAFFRVYKDLPDPHIEVEVGPWEDRDAALRTIREAIAAAQPEDTPSPVESEGWTRAPPRPDLRSPGSATPVGEQNSPFGRSIRSDGDSGPCSDPRFTNGRSTDGTRDEQTTEFPDGFATFGGAEVIRVEQHDPVKNLRSAVKQREVLERRLGLDDLESCRPVRVRDVPTVLDLGGAIGSLGSLER